MGRILNSIRCANRRPHVQIPQHLFRVWLRPGRTRTLNGFSKRISNPTRVRPPSRSVSANNQRDGRGQPPDSLDSCEGEHSRRHRQTVEERNSQKHKGGRQQYRQVPKKTRENLGAQDDRSERQEDGWRADDEVEMLDSADEIHADIGHVQGIIPIQRADVERYFGEADHHEDAATEKRQPTCKPIIVTCEEDDSESEEYYEKRTDSLQPGSPEDRSVVLVAKGNQLIVGRIRGRSGVDGERDHQHGDADHAGD